MTRGFVIFHVHAGHYTQGPAGEDALPALPVTYGDGSALILKKSGHGAELAGHNEDIAFPFMLYGVYYSSLSYPKRFPINTLKIDRSCVCDIPRDADDRLITTAIISLAHSLGIQVVAEGVESRAQLTFLQNQHCDVMQGYY